MRKKFSIIVLLMLMCFMMSGCIHISTGRTYDGSERHESGDATVSDNIKEIDIEWSNGNIDVVYDDVDKISFNETSENELDADEIMSYKIDGSKLEIDFVKSNKLVNLDSISKNLTLIVPNDLILEDFSIDGVSVNVNIEQNAFTKEMNIDIVSGNVVAYLYGGTDEIKVDSVSGNIELNVLDEGFTVEFDTVSGSFFSDFETVGKKDVFVYGNGNRNYEVESISGNLTIKRL